MTGRVSDEGTVLKALLRERHCQTHSVFTREYDRAAATCESHMVGHGPQKAQFYRWLAGEVQGLPYPDHCRVLRAMFPDYTVEELFAPYMPTGRDDATLTQHEADAAHGAESRRAEVGSTAAEGGREPARSSVDVRGLMSWIPSAPMREVA